MIIESIAIGPGYGGCVWILREMNNNQTTPAKMNNNSTLNRLSRTLHSFFEKIGKSSFKKIFSDKVGQNIIMEEKFEH